MIIVLNESIVSLASSSAAQFPYSLSFLISEKVVLSSIWFIFFVILYFLFFCLQEVLVIVVVMNQEETPQCQY
jgi:hypothetical protein